MKLNIGLYLKVDFLGLGTGVAYNRNGKKTHMDIPVFYSFVEVNFSQTHRTSGHMK